MLLLTFYVVVYFGILSLIFCEIKHLKSLDLPTPSINVFESLDFTVLEKNGLVQRRALPPDTRWDQPYDPRDQYVLQLSPLIASMIISKST